MIGTRVLAARNLPEYSGHTFTESLHEKIEEMKIGDAAAARTSCVPPLAPTGQRRRAKQPTYTRRAKRSMPSSYPRGF